MSEKNENKKKIEIISEDDGSTLEISPLYENINTVKPKDGDNKPKNIVIPEERSKNKNNEKNEDKDKKK
ncbi:MAG: hypothetical protein HFJ48_07970 [Clostridia bacterium]|nr:hypothetical protein [Clostridia bacterium]